MEYRYRRYDGVYRWLLEVGQPQFAADGSYAGVVGSCVDISEHREIEAALRATEAELRQARQQLVDGIEGLTDGFALFDKDDRLVAWNSRYAELSGTDAVLLKRGVRFEDILRAHVKARREPSAIGREEEWIATRLAQHRDPKGSFERIINGRWYRFSDRPTIRRRHRHDLCADRRTETTRRAAARKSDDPAEHPRQHPGTVSITDRDRRIVLLNRKLEELYGVKLQDVIGRPLGEVRPERYASIRRRRTTSPLLRQASRSKDGKTNISGKAAKRPGLRASCRSRTKRATSNSCCARRSKFLNWPKPTENWRTTRHF